MIEKKHIAAVKAAQRDAGLSDQEYRKLLNQEFGVSSCKELDDQDVSDAITRIRSAGGRRDGWKPAQIRKFRQYAKWCGMTPKQYRGFLYEAIQVPHEESPYLSQAHFDDVMATIEEELEFRIMNDGVEKPAKIKLTYWRDRRPQFGLINTREKNKIMTLWKDLTGFLPDEKCTIPYLLHIAAKAIGRKIASVDKLASTEALKLIEALKSKLHAEQSKLQQQVPF